MVTLCDATPAAVSTGERFAQAYEEKGIDTELEYDYTITEEFKPGENRPRIAMISWVMKRRKLDRDSVHFWSEQRSANRPEGASDDTRKWKEFRVRFKASETRIRPIQAWIQVPEEILADPQSLGDYIDYRLIPRLGTVENQEVLIGVDGILRHPELEEVHYSGSFSEGLMKSCNEVEQNGATAHVIIVNSRDYYGSLVENGRLLRNLEINGNIILRTRMVSPGCAVVGDFNVATRFYHKGRSVIRFAKPPDGLFAGNSLALCAETYIGVSLNLPTHIYHMHPA